ncbi:hypothetical protein HII36_45600 [Nonomuraea sp. NN258]|uniref:hypothetical protein n=1 Tax=Nonomuraea antri TaxID=2730852 RepID=UPI0015690B2C|nr:hypothetical protein [Nonomuraea antri]NRQ39050.1 hypothetical protein [Nonomuraea antri]
MDRNDLAYLSGGRPRVALAALATLLLDGRLRTSYAGKLYQVTGATAADPVEQAALAQRSTIKEALETLTEHESVLAVESDLIGRDLVSRTWLGRRRTNAAGRDLVEQAKQTRQSAPVRIALNGLTSVPDDKLRAQLAGATKKAGSLRGQGTGGWSVPTSEYGESSGSSSSGT